MTWNNLTPALKPDRSTAYVEPDDGQHRHRFVLPPASPLLNGEYEGVCSCGVTKIHRPYDAEIKARAHVSQRMAK